MAKYKPAGRKKAAAAPKARGALPCIFIVILGIALMVLLFYGMLHNGPAPAKTTPPASQPK